MLLVAGSSYAAHPLITDDVGTQGRGKFQLEVNTEFAGDEKAEAGVTIEEKGIEASTILSRGISENADILIWLPFVQAEVREAGTTVFDEQGISDGSPGNEVKILRSRGNEPCVQTGLDFSDPDREKRTGSREVMVLTMCTTGKGR